MKTLLLIIILLVLIYFTWKFNERNARRAPCEHADYLDEEEEDERLLSIPAVPIQSVGEYMPPDYDDVDAATPATESHPDDREPIPEDCQPSELEFVNEGVMSRDMANIKYAQMSSRAKRSLTQRSFAEYRDLYQDEFERNDSREWWDDVQYQ